MKIENRELPDFRSKGDVEQWINEQVKPYVADEHKAILTLANGISGAAYFGASDALADKANTLIEKLDDLIYVPDDQESIDAVVQALGDMVDTAQAENYSHAEGLRVVALLFLNNSSYGVTNAYDDFDAHRFDVA